MKFDLDKYCKRVDESRPVKRIECKDGFSMSVQAGIFLYCEPVDNKGPWISFEIGFPSEEEILLNEFADIDLDDDTDLTGIIYILVPKQVILNVIRKHGGIK